MRGGWGGVLGAIWLAACGPGAWMPPGGGEAPDPLGPQPSVGQQQPGAVPTITHSLPPLGKIEPLHPSVPPGGFPAVQGALPELFLELAPADLAALDADPTSDRTVPVRVTLAGKAVLGQVRYRGASTRTLPQKSFKVELDPGYALEGRDHFELLAEYLDGGKLSEKFEVDLYEALKLRVPAARYVRVWVNGKSNGLYLDMEHVGKDFIKAHGLEKGASIYRCGGRNCELTLTSGPYQEDFEKKTNEETGRADLDAFLRFVNRTDDAQFEQGLESWLELDAYLGNLAADALVSNNIIEDSQSYWIHELGRNRWVYVPWDLNNAQMFFWRALPLSEAPPTRRHPMAFTAYDPNVQVIYETRLKENARQRPTWSVLATRVWDRPALRARILDKLEQALGSAFAQAPASEHAAALDAFAREPRAADPFVDQPHAQAALAYLRSYLDGRRAYLLSQLPALRAHGGGPLVVNELGFDAAGGGYVELFNRGTAPVALSAWCLTDDLRTPHRLPLSGTLAPGARQVVRLDGLSTAGGEVGIFPADKVYGPADLVFYGPHSAGTAYGRTLDGSETFRSLPQTPGGPNGG